MVLRHLHRAVVAEEIRRVQHVHVQHVAFDPLAAIQQPAQRADLRRDGDAERVLHRVHRAHLVGDRADAADAGGDVRHFHAGTAAQEGLEEPRRFEDAQLGVAQLAVLDHQAQRALAFDPRQHIDLDRPTFHDGRSPRGTPRRRR